MERNYILLTGLFLLLVAVDFSSSDPKGNVKEDTGLDQNVDGAVDSVKGNNVTEPVSVSVNKVQKNGEDQVNGLQEGTQSDTTESKLDQQSGSNKNENLDKDVKESGAEATGKMDGAENGENADKGQEGSDVDAKVKTGDGGNSENVDKGREGSNIETKRKTDDDKTGSEEEGKDVHKDEGGSNFETKGKMPGEKKENSGDNLDPKEVIEEKNSAQDSVPSPPPPPTMKDGIRVEECDRSNMCMDKNERFAACLRVPGDDFPDLSLLIQNKGKGPLTIKIFAPVFVHLEETNVELQEKEDRKVKVSIKDSGTENLIVLKGGSGECSLDFKDFIVHNSAKAYVNILSQTPTTAFMFIVAILILASGWMCMSFKRRQVARSGLKHQRLPMELPVSVRAKTEPDVNDGWDNSWGDNWDDEETPMTPSMPVTPRLSSKGLASRRLNKEGWKD